MQSKNVIITICMLCLLFFIPCVALGEVAQTKNADGTVCYSVCTADGMQLHDPIHMRLYLQAIFTTIMASISEVFMLVTLMMMNIWQFTCLSRIISAALFFKTCSNIRNHWRLWAT